MRPAETYRGARRNACFNGHYVWGPQWYFGGHRGASAKRERKSKRAWEQAASMLGLAPKAAPQPALRLRRSARGQ